MRQRDPSRPNSILARPKISALAALVNPAPILDFVLPGLLSGTAGMIIAPGATGKTWLALQIGIAIAGGLPVCEGVWGAIPASGKVLVLTWEDPEPAIQGRLKAIMERLKSRGASESLLHQIDENIDTRSMHGETAELMDRNGESGPLLDDLLEAAEGQRLLILDPFARIHRGEERDNGQMTRVISLLEHVAHKTGATVVVLHHTNKDAALNGTVDIQQAARGASALVDNVRWLAALQTMTAAEAESYGIDNVVRKHWVRLAVPKANYTPPLPDSWLRRESGVLVMGDPKRNRDSIARGAEKYAAASGNGSDYDEIF